jgi:MoxR-like ATPase
MQKIQEIINQVRKSVIGKDDVIEKTLMAMLAGGHILLEDVPGVGKTSMAIAFSQAMDLSYKRMQFTPDVMPSDVTGYTMYDRNSGKNVYIPGAAMCNLFLADEINRTSSKTQSALLEVMEEGSITVDGVTRQVPQPYLVIATQNPIGSAGTQPLPESQMDRFMVRLSMGYPDKQSEMEMLRRRQPGSHSGRIQTVVTPQELREMQQEVESIFVSEPLYKYITDLASWTRMQPAIRLGLSPRGTLALFQMAKACAFFHGRDFLTPQDVQEVFPHVCIHRIWLDARAKVNGTGRQQIIRQALFQVAAPVLV